MRNWTFRQHPIQGLEEVIQSGDSDTLVVMTIKDQLTAVFIERGETEAEATAKATQDAYLAEVTEAAMFYGVQPQELLITQLNEWRTAKNVVADVEGEALTAEVEDKITNLQSWLEESASGEAKD